jgi:hypothetical protein
MVYFLKKAAFPAGIAVIGMCVAAALSCASATPRQNPDMVAEIDPIELGTVTMQFDKLFSSTIETKDVTVSFDPRTNSVCLAFKYESVYYREYWDKPIRDAFIAGYDRYSADFEAGTLLTKDSKSKDIYGILPGKTQWSAFNASFANISTSYPNVMIGYTFKKDASGKSSPYFSVLQLAAYPVDRDGNRLTDGQDSLRIRSYFTRAQAESLCAYLDQTYLMEQVRGYGRPAAEDDASVYTPKADDYNAPTP